LFILVRVLSAYRVATSKRKRDIFRRFPFIDPYFNLIFGPDIIL
jgi:hypothetical protein